MPLKKTPHWRSKRRQAGLSLIESLVALVVLALGVMGLAGVQTRLLVETRTANSRAIAVQLIDDLSNRMALNRFAAVGRPQLDLANPQYSVSSYSLAWSNTTGVGVAMPASNPFNCVLNICTPAQLAASDLFQWRTAVNAAFPGAQAAVLALPPTTNDARQLAVAIAWPLNERTITGATTAENIVYNAQFNVTLFDNTTCPNGLICHVVYVHP